MGILLKILVLMILIVFGWGIITVILSGIFALPIILITNIIEIFANWINGE